MYIVVRRYVGASKLIDDTLERQSDVKELLSSVPGFRAYYGVNTGNGGVTTITVCDDEAGTSESSRRAAEWVRNNVSDLTIAPPEIIEGESYLNF
jgi:hypothetical protein